MSKDEIQMLLFDLGYEQSEENMENNYLEFENGRMSVDINIDNSITVYYCDNKILEIEDISYENMAIVIEGLEV